MNTREQNMYCAAVLAAGGSVQDLSDLLEVEHSSAKNMLFSWMYRFIRDQYSEQGIMDAVREQLRRPPQLRLV